MSLFFLLYYILRGLWKYKYIVENRVDFEKSINREDRKVKNVEAK